MASSKTTKNSYAVNTKKIKKIVKEKECSICHEIRPYLNFYASSSPLFSVDGRVSVCKSCVIASSIDQSTGIIVEKQLSQTLRSIDKPYYKDSLVEAFYRTLKENPYITEKGISRHGDKILGNYFKIISLARDRDKTYADSEEDGFCHLNISVDMSKLAIIFNTDIDGQMDFSVLTKVVEWTDIDKQNKKYVISATGYDPFDDIGLTEEDKKYCYNTLAGYYDTEGVIEDGHKTQSVIEMTLLYCQCKKITEEMNRELVKDNVSYDKVAKLTTTKTSLLSSISSIAKDNNISSNYNKQAKKGMDSISSKMKEMEKVGFDNILVNMFDIKTSEAFKQIDKISNTNIANQLTLDNNDYTEIIKEQREMVQSLTSQVNVLKEENRVLQNKIVDFTKE